VGEAFKTTPRLFSEYIWHCAIGTGETPIVVPKKNNKVRTLVTLFTFFDFFGFSEVFF
jgi:hypothetical protein